MLLEDTISQNTLWSFQYFWLLFHNVPWVVSVEVCFVGLSINTVLHNSAFWLVKTFYNGLLRQRKFSSLRGRGKSHRASILYKDLKAPEWEKEFSPGNGTAIIVQCQMVSSKNKHTRKKTDQIIFIYLEKYMHMHIHISI